MYLTSAFKGLDRDCITNLQWKMLETEQLLRRVYDEFQHELTVERRKDRIEEDAGGQRVLWKVISFASGRPRFDVSLDETQLFTKSRDEQEVQRQMYAEEGSTTCTFLKMC